MTMAGTHETREDKFTQLARLAALRLAYSICTATLRNGPLDLKETGKDERISDNTKSVLSVAASIVQ